jgi:transglutaminase-like putative cysteine protease
VEFAIDFEYDVSAYYPQPRDEQARPLPADWAGGNLEERPPHIVFSPELKRTVADVVGEETNPLAKGRKIFLFVEREIRYAAEEEYTVIPSFSMKALTQRKGDCGVQAMLFITMCRAAGIPARWQSGWETKPVGWNMHDWAEFYVEPWGWLPADVSYGLQASDDPHVREFFFGNIDTYRLIGNLDYGSELHPPKESLRSEPADFQRGEVEIDGRNLYFDEWTYEISFEWKPLKKG